jgi:uncharacterized membrane protein YkoI
MKTYIRNIALVAAITMPITAMAGQQAIDKCIESIEKVKKGNILKLESLGVNGKTIYEFEVADQNGFEWELMCDAATGKVIEIESEVDSPKSKAFSEKAKITEEDALKIALKSYPGKVEEVEYEIEENGEPTFEIDIMGKNGVETKVEVDAITGKIIEVSIEKWEIGAEEDESR